MTRRIPAVVVGATGYVGGELLRLLGCHPVFELQAAVSESSAGQPIASVFPNLATSCDGAVFSAPTEWLGAVDNNSELAVFSASPHGASAAHIATILDAAEGKGLDVHLVDSSADFRYASDSEFESVYGIRHGAPSLLGRFSCGVPEQVSKITTPHVGHPGCFATAILLAAVPLLQSGIVDSEFFVSAITGSTGSGRKPQPGTHHPERHSNLYAYKPLVHRHTPEICALAEAASGTRPLVNFVPHSGPFARGIHATLQAKANKPVSNDELMSIFEKTYATAPFIELVTGTPRIKNVVASNLAQIGVAVEGDTVVVMSAIDNLVKGAAGGAVQWMNRLWGLDESTGLTAVSPAWT